MARQVLIPRIGPPEVLRLITVPTPEVTTGEVRIQVKAIGLYRAEVDLRAGTGQVGG